jgi:hypothetical protein
MASVRRLLLMYVESPPLELTAFKKSRIKALERSPIGKVGQPTGQEEGLVPC